MGNPGVNQRKSKSNYSKEKYKTAELCGSEINENKPFVQLRKVYSTKDPESEKMNFFFTKKNIQFFSSFVLTFSDFLV